METSPLHRALKHTRRCAKRPPYRTCVHHEQQQHVNNCSSCICFDECSAPAPPKALTPWRSSLLLRVSSRRCAEAEPVSSTRREKCDCGSASSTSGSSNSKSSPA